MSSHEPTATDSARLDLLAAVESERASMPTRLFDVPSMLSYEERALLRHCARVLSVGDGAIVDAGCFLGGSTMALADGLRARSTPFSAARIHSFDLFRVGDERERVYFSPDFDFHIGADTRSTFDATIAAYRDLVRVHAGDVTDTASRFDEQIAVLFIDIAKSWETNDAVVKHFFGRLQPGAIVIQQDLVHFGHPWCALTMEMLHEHFEYLGHVRYSSAVYRLIKPLGSTERPLRLLERLSFEQMVALIDRSADRIGEPDSGYVRLAAGWALSEHGRAEQARAVVRTVAENPLYAELPWIDEHVTMLLAMIDQKHPKH